MVLAMLARAARGPHRGPRRGLPARLAAGALRPVPPLAAVLRDGAGAGAGSRSPCLAAITAAILYFLPGVAHRRLDLRPHRHPAAARCSRSRPRAAAGSTWSRSSTSAAMMLLWAVPRLGAPRERRSGAGGPLRADDPAVLARGPGVPAVRPRRRRPAAGLRLLLRRAHVPARSCSRWGRSR
ncbi:MAG: hypothetical protein MZW92_11975 [Comamonadaceae bacterium]|nr:hypothetical protein [Comamonadaceae bacterium]